MTAITLKDGLLHFSNQGFLAASCGIELGIAGGEISKYDFPLY